MATRRNALIQLAFVVSACLPCAAAADGFAELERLRAARAAATQPTERNVLRLQEALLSSLLGLPEAAERLTRKTKDPQLAFLSALLRGTVAAPPLGPAVDAATRERIHRWLERRAACSADEVAQAPLLCGGLR